MSNDSKYVRLYPERAVAPARAALEQCRRWFGTGGNPSILKPVVDALAALDSLGFPSDEPLFLLRGQDVLAPYIVREYAGYALREGAFGLVNGPPPRGQATFDHLIDHADRMERWQPRKLPD